MTAWTGCVPENALAPSLAAAAAQDGGDAAVTAAVKTRMMEPVKGIFLHPTVLMLDGTAAKLLDVLYPPNAPLPHTPKYDSPQPKWWGYSPPNAPASWVTFEYSLFSAGRASGASVAGMESSDAFTPAERISEVDAALEPDSSNMCGAVQSVAETVAARRRMAASALCKSLRENRLSAPQELQHIRIISCRDIRQRLSVCVIGGDGAALQDSLRWNQVKMALRPLCVGEEAYFVLLPSRSESRHDKANSTRHNRDSELFEVLHIRLLERRLQEPFLVHQLTPLYIFSLQTPLQAQTTETATTTDGGENDPEKRFEAINPFVFFHGSILFLPLTIHPRSAPISEIKQYCDFDEEAGKAVDNDKKKKKKKSEGVGEKKGKMVRCEQLKIKGAEGGNNSADGEQENDKEDAPEKSDAEWTEWHSRFCHENARQGFLTAILAALGSCQLSGTPQPITIQRDGSYSVDLAQLYDALAANGTPHSPTPVPTSEDAMGFLRSRFFTTPRDGATATFSVTMHSRLTGKDTQPRRVETELLGGTGLSLWLDLVLQTMRPRDEKFVAVCVGDDEKKFLRGFALQLHRTAGQQLSAYESNAAPGDGKAANAACPSAAFGYRPPHNISCRVALEEVRQTLDISAFFFVNPVASLAAVRILAKEAAALYRIAGPTNTAENEEEEQQEQEAVEEPPPACAVAPIVKLTRGPAGILSRTIAVRGLAKAVQKTNLTVLLLTFNVNEESALTAVPPEVIAERFSALENAFSTLGKLYKLIFENDVCPCSAAAQNAAGLVKRFAEEKLSTT